MVIETIKTPEGVDISKYWNGKPAYYTNGQTSPDGKSCILSLVVNNSQFGKVERLAIKGHVMVLLATKREEKKLELTATDDQETKVGPFSVRNFRLPVTTTSATVAPQPAGPFARTEPAGVGVAAPPCPTTTTGTSYAAAYATSTYAVPASYIAPVMGVSITGPLNSLIDAKFRDGEHELQLGSASWENTRTYSLPKPKAGKVTLTLSYWLDLTKATLPIVQ
jgi:hypothetical protein